MTESISSTYRLIWRR